MRESRAEEEGPFSGLTHLGMEVRGVKQVEEALSRFLGMDFCNIFWNEKKAEILPFRV